MLANTKQIMIIPQPVRIQTQSGECIFGKNLEIWAKPNLENCAQILNNILVNIKDCHPLLRIVENIDKKPRSIYLGIVSNQQIQPEGYRLKITSEGIEILGSQPQGVFYGIQTLRQLFPSEIENPYGEFSKISLPCLEINDYPRFKWRGFMMDECRHFFGKEFIKKTLDVMALHKMNTLHWHLTEDQGWRIEIRKYPKLTQIGSQRELNITTGETAIANQPGKYGGFYSQADIREILQYATDRYINIVPEIEMPGHAMAAITSYPEFSCTNGPFTVPNHWGVFKDVYCAGKESVFSFLQEVLTEVMEIFPSSIIHTGGDEVPKNRWQLCPDCQQRIKIEKLTNEHALQCYLTNRISKFLESKNRRLMGWNEIVDPNLAKNAIVQHWMGPIEPIMDEIKKGREVVVSRSSHIYLDHNYKHSSLSRVYSFDPIPESLPTQYHTQILGIEAPLWTERVVTVQRAHYQTYPRLTAVAEIGWSPKDQRNYPDFHRRFLIFKQRLQKLGIQPANLKDYEPHFWIRWKLQ